MLNLKGEMFVNLGKQSFVPASTGDNDNNDDGGSARKRKKRSRWGNEDPGERLFIPGMPTILPSNLSKEQEEAYLRKFLLPFLLVFLS